MKVVEVLIQYVSQSLNRPFTYLYEKDKKIDVGFRVLVYFAHRKCVAYVTNISESNETKEQLEQRSGYTLFYIQDVLDDSQLLNDELMKLADEVSDYYLAPKISVLQTMLPTSLKPSLSSLKGPHVAYEQHLVVINNDEKDLTPKQIELLRLIDKNKDILKKEAKSPSIVQKLINVKRIAIKNVEISRYKQYVTDGMYSPKILTREQINAVKSIIDTNKEVTLLQGITGSGKTEVYLSVCEQILLQGKNVLMLVPEISLTPAMVHYFIVRFKEQVAVIHSGLTPGEKYDEYRRIARGQVKIVVGARSAIFAPLNNIGLIILDEEHVESYKQDNVPYYHAREVALMRAKHFNAKVLLGSATPSLESRARALKGVYNYATLTNRINDSQLPKTTIVNLLDNSNLTRESSIFSTVLIKKMKQTLSQGHQIVILINRRGYSNYVSCRSCGYVFKCPNCGISLTYHKEDNMLKCHHCGHVELMPKICPECQSSYISKMGFGTERILDDLNKLFPDAKTIRLDSDVSKVRKNMSQILNDFKNKKADILVGTQMVAKGHDFENVTLVAVLLADLGLSVPSFRSSERTFQLITQAIGRSGRGIYPGEAIIQTYMPKNYAIVLAAKQDYETFFAKEMEIRKISQYPPYTFVTTIDIASKNENLADVCINKIALQLSNIKENGFSFLGPVTPYIFKENDFYHRNIILKYKNGEQIKKYLTNLLLSLQKKSSIKISIDVDSYNF